MRFLAFALLTLPGFVAAQQTDADRLARIRATAPAIAEMFRRYAEENELPGLAYGVVAGGELVVSGAFGHSDLANETPADTKTMFRIASM
ncbi:MAG: beta-lactamase family protein, partial [Gammaproteobacteria bacterium]|nr:beta-lactamase family protein [Gammaproteobacteria bacterium]